MTDTIIKQMLAFKKAYKKSHSREKKYVNEAVQAIVKNPQLGQEKKGDLSGVFVYKFKASQQELLLAYEWDLKHRVLLMLGV